jgi:hypothetical protein
VKLKFSIGDRVTVRELTDAGMKWEHSGKRGEVINTSYIGSVDKGTPVHLVWFLDEERAWIRPGDLERTDVIDALGDIGSKA